MMLPIPSPSDPLREERARRRFNQSWNVISAPLAPQPTDERSDVYSLPRSGLTSFERPQKYNRKKKSTTKPKKKSKRSK